MVFKIWCIFSNIDLKNKAPNFDMFALFIFQIKAIFIERENDVKKYELKCYYCVTLSGFKHCLWSQNYSNKFYRQRYHML